VLKYNREIHNASVVPLLLVGWPGTEHIPFLKTTLFDAMALRTGFPNIDVYRINYTSISLVGPMPP